MLNVNSMIDSIENFESFIKYSFNSTMNNGWSYDADSDSFAINGDIDMPIYNIEYVKSDYVYYCKLPFNIKSANIYRAIPDPLFFKDELQIGTGKNITLREVRISNPEYFPETVETLLDISQCIVDLNLVKTKPQNDKHSCLFINEKSIPAFPLIQTAADFRKILPKNISEFEYIRILNVLIHRQLVKNGK